MIRFFTVCNPGGSHCQGTVFEQNMSFKPLVCCLLIYLEPNFSNIFNQNNFFSLVTNKRRLVKIKHQPRFASFSRSAELIVAKIFKQTLIISPRLLFSCARSRNLNFPPLVQIQVQRGHRAQTNMSPRVSLSRSILLSSAITKCTVFVISDPSFCHHHFVHVARRRKEKVCMQRQIAMRSVNATF